MIGGIRIEMETKITFILIKLYCAQEEHIESNIRRHDRHELPTTTWIKGCLSACQWQSIKKLFLVLKKSIFFIVAWSGFKYGHENFGKIQFTSFIKIYNKRCFLWSKVFCSISANLTLKRLFFTCRGLLNYIHKCAAIILRFTFWRFYLVKWIIGILSLIPTIQNQLWYSMAN